MRRHRRALLLAIALLTLSPLAMAQQQRLYDPLPPPGSAYLRFVNAVGTEVALRPDFLPELRLGTTPARRIGAYAVVERVAGRQLVLELRAGGATARASLRAMPGSFVTVLLQQAADGTLQAVPIEDKTEFNQLRARLTFYNATADCAAAALAVEPGGLTVFQDLRPGSAATRSVNPVTAQLRASCTGHGGNAQTAPSFALEGLQPGGLYSIWLMQPGGTAEAFVTSDTTQPWRP